MAKTKEPLEEKKELTELELLKIIANKTNDTAYDVNVIKIYVMIVFWISVIAGAISLMQ